MLTAFPAEVRCGKFDLRIKNNGPSPILCNNYYITKLLVTACVNDIERILNTTFGVHNIFTVLFIDSHSIANVWIEEPLTWFSPQQLLNSFNEYLTFIEPYMNVDFSLLVTTYNDKGEVENFICKSLKWPT